MRQAKLEQRKTGSQASEVEAKSEPSLKHIGGG